MGKGGKLKIKTYKIPDEKYVVVINSWADARSGGSQTPHFNSIGAWFELMFKGQLRPGDTGVLTIYYQSTHRNLIVELLPYIDIIDCLGEHHHKRFVNDNNTSGTSWIYEYNYEKFGDPSENSWTAGYPSYTRIHSKFPVISPYPPASPAPEYPPPDVRWAKKLSNDDFERLQERITLWKALNENITVSPSQSGLTQEPSQTVLASPSGNPRDPRVRHSSESMTASSESSSHTPSLPSNQQRPDQELLFTPYEPPSHHPNHTRYPSVNNRIEETPHNGRTGLSQMTKPEPRESKINVKKLDPYEEDELSSSILRSNSTVKSEQESSTFPAMVKREHSQDIASFRNNYDSRRSMTLQTPAHTNWSKEDRPSVKREPDVHVKKEKREDYEPSKELLTAFTSLPPELRNPSVPSSIRSSETYTPSAISVNNVKKERREEEEYEPSKELLKAFSSLPPKALQNSPVLLSARRSESTASIKNEDTYHLAKQLALRRVRPDVSNHSIRVGVKYEPDIGASQLVRSPGESDRRNIKRSPSSEREASSVKRVKTG